MYGRFGYNEINIHTYIHIHACPSHTLWLLWCLNPPAFHAWPQHLWRLMPLITNPVSASVHRSDFVEKVFLIPNMTPSTNNLSLQSTDTQSVTGSYASGSGWVMGQRFQPGPITCLFIMFSVDFWCWFEVSRQVAQQCLMYFTLEFI